MKGAKRPESTRSRSRRRWRFDLGPLKAALCVAVLGTWAAAGEWNVEESLGFPREVLFETSKGTWLNLDVSPDGRYVVFDLLGDIYRIPIEGGEARPLREGPAFDQLPRISPDGTRIVFVSDRGGADNLWTMTPEGEDLRSLTSESENLPTNPTWTPDGNWVVYKRHVVDRRSLGGGEIWMVHRLGGQGQVLVEKESFTSDINEPDVSPDGRYVYFSRSGPFDYNRNVHQGIFQIRRYDLQHGTIQAVTLGPGGAVRPVISPDGSRLAFVRRVGTRTVLFVRDLESGAERPVFDGLDKDQMETWTVHGAYPAFDWLPSGDAVVISFGGGIHRVDVDTGAAEPIPFHVSVRQRLAQRVHYPQRAVEGPTFRARMIRWPQALADGSALVFQAVGRIWIMDLPDGDPRPLTEADVLAFAPSLAPDGSWMAYVTWDDDDGGALWRRSLQGGKSGEPVRLTRVPDQYANPAIAPDGSRIAFVQGSGRVNRGADLGAEPYLRLRWISSQGGAIHDVTTTENRGPNRRMPRLFWDKDGRYLYYFETRTDGGASKTHLSRIRLDGSDRLSVAIHDTAEEIVPSPDGAYAAFKAEHNVYLSPLTYTGRPAVLKEEGGPLPTKALTRYGGDWITWSPDGRSVSWILGATWVRQSVDAVLSEPEATPEHGEGGEADAPAEGEETLGPNPVVPGDEVSISLRVPREIPEGTLVLQGATIITMNGDEVLPSGIVVIREDRIAAVGRRGEVSIPAGARVVDLTGKVIVPGLVDVHAHMGYNALDINPERPWQYIANLAYGVTTTHDPSASTQLVFSNAELVEAGRIRGPRIFSTGFILYGAKNPNRARVDDLNDARAHLRRLKAVGAFSVKSYNQLRREARQWIIKAAREEKMMVYPEGGSMLQQDLTHVVDGHTGIEHAIPVAPLYRDVVTLLARSGTGYTPTLIVGYGGIWGENYWYQVDDVFRDERLLKFVPRSWLDARARRRLLAPVEEFHHFLLAREAKRILDAGGQVQLGAHGQLQGLGAHWELWMMTQGGMTPMEALRVGTLNGARYLGMEKDLGSLEPGKLADLVVLDADPRDDIRNSEKVHAVMKGGFLYDDEVNRIWPRGEPRGALRGVDRQAPAR